MKERERQLSYKKASLGSDWLGTLFHAESLGLYLINYGESLKVLEQGLLMATNPIL